MRLLKLLLPLLLGFTAVSALAGYKSSTPLVISIANKHAYGQVSTVRYSASTTERIGCSINSPTESECYAVDAQRVIGRCKTSSSDFHRAIQMINNTSYIYFEWIFKNGMNTCTRIYVSNYSYNLR